MSLLDLVLRDVREQTFNAGGVESPLEITDKDGNQFTVNGWAIVHSVQADIDNGGDFVAVGNNASITFSEADLKDAGATTRRGNDLNLTDWVVEFDLPHGHVKALIAEPEPDSTFGVIRANITDYE